MAQNVTLVPPGANDHRIIDVNSTSAGHPDIAFDIPVQKTMVPPPPRAQARPPPMVRPVRPPPQIHHPSPAPPQPEELNDFANPHKLEDSEDEEGSPGDEEESPGEQFGEQYDYQQQQQEYDEYPQEYPQTPPPPTIQPTPPFTSIEDERADLMYKLQRAGKNGISVRNYSWNTDIRELRVEAARARTEQEINASVAFQRHMLMMMCTGLEYANNKWSYFDLELDGWSTSVMDDIGKYDVIFEKLHKKHAGNFNLPPELQLMFMIGGSAMTWHLVSKSAKDRTRREKRQKRKRVYSSSESSESELESDRERDRRRYSRPATSARSRDGSPPRAKAGAKREMKGPGFDAGGLVGGLGGMAGMAGLGGMGGLGGLVGSLGGLNNLPRVPVEDLTPKFTRQGKAKMMIESAESSPRSSPEEDRLSDIPSEDLDEVPSNFGSPEDDDRRENAREDTQEDTRVIEVTEKPRRRAPKKKNDTTKKVVVI